LGCVRPTSGLRAPLGSEMININVRSGVLIATSMCGLVLIISGRSAGRRLAGCEDVTESD
jgi:hypothetical protein